jgi:hypothetical protein
MPKTVFDDDETLAIIVAYENAVAALVGKDKAPSVRARVAKVILSLAKRGDLDPTRLYLSCLREMTPAL